MDKIPKEQDRVELTEGGSGASGDAGDSDGNLKGAHSLA
jgi:hypothetical protein